MAPSPPDLSGELIDRRFRVEYLLGSGGMGSVWAVRHVESLQRFALKTIAPELLLHPEPKARFLREVRAAAALRTRHVVRVTDAQTSYVHKGQPLPFFVMELLEGASLEQLLARRILSPGELCWAMRHLGRALAAAHRQGIVHRDLKPANVFVAFDEDGVPICKLCDFGVAKLIGDAALRLGRTDDATTQTGAVFGTPRYMAPEQLRGAGHAVPATDQWALGLIAFRALAGRDYFEDALSPTALVLSIAAGPSRLPSEICSRIPRPFDRWFLKSCHCDADQRFPDVTAQVDELGRALANPKPVAVHPIGTGSLPPNDSLAPPLGAPLSRRFVFSVSALTVGTVLAIVAVQISARGFLEATVARGLPWARGDGPSQAPEPNQAASAPGGVSLPSGSVTPASGVLPIAVTPASSPEGPALAQEAATQPSSRVPLPAGPHLGRIPRPHAPPRPSASHAPPDPSTLRPGASVPGTGTIGQACERSAECASGVCLSHVCH